MIDNIVIGPFIGILAAHSEKKLKKLLKRLSHYIDHSAHFTDALIPFSTEGILEKIHGLVFDQKSASWQKTVCPIPIAVYRRLR
ncbi:hypothetical protein [Mesobacillus harenae]|uniref:hypothetical protein n=1 Tax=Mesobacillus harenae TaxID=2213203 RepID=UPI001580819B|nr:hypothetical protein [Mesobacillus harenae]